MKKKIIEQKRILTVLSMVLILIIIPFYLFENLGEPVDADSSELKFYGMVLAEDATKEELVQIKNTVNESYNIVDWFDDNNFLTFSTIDNLDVVEKKVGIYGTIEELTNVKNYFE
jgi:hypothetical protein